MKLGSGSINMQVLETSIFKKERLTDAISLAATELEIRTTTERMSRITVNRRSQGWTERAGTKPKTQEMESEQKETRNQYGTLLQV